MKLDKRPILSTDGYDEETGEALLETMDGWERIDYRRIRHIMCCFGLWVVIRNKHGK